MSNHPSPEETLERRKKLFFYETRNFICEMCQSVGPIRHMHNQVEMIYFQKGSANVLYNFQEFHIKEGELVLFFPHMIHAFQEIEPISYLLTIFESSVFPNFYRCFNQQEIQGSPVISKTLLHSDVDYALEQLCTREELQQQTPLTESFLSIILAHLLQTFPLEMQKDRSQQHFIYLALQYLNENFTKTVVLDQIAQELSMSRGHLSRSFNQFVGCSLTQYLHHLRIERAKDLLRSTDLPVTNVAGDCGFDSLSSFFRVFKSATHCSPKEFRIREEEKARNTQSGIPPKAPQSQQWQVLSGKTSSLITGNL